jgi:acyl-CoA synthetase (AMP-forming)/AMP-acid ligase II
LVALLDDGSSPLPDLRQATLGGEASSSKLLDDVRRLFPRAKVSHVYASTEVGSGVSVGDGQQGLPLSILERPDDAEVQFRIVDGQLEARSDVGMFGYHGDESGESEDGWRATGDLVEVREGRIYFVGRASETINVGGVKVHPLSIEDVVTKVPGVQLAHAYARSNPVSGQIVAVDIVPVLDTDLDDLEDAVREACEILAPAAQPRRIRFVDEIDLRENKISRSKAAQ